MSTEMMGYRQAGYLKKFYHSTPAGDLPGEYVNAGIPQEAHPRRKVPV
jgi:hypothetical protein